MDDLFDRLGRALDEAGLKPYLKAVDPADPGICIHGVSVKRPCEECRARYCGKVDEGGENE